MAPIAAAASGPTNTGARCGRSNATAPTGQPRAIGHALTAVAEACGAVGVEAVIAATDVVAVVVAATVVDVVPSVTGVVVVVSVVVGPLVVVAVVVVAVVGVSGKAGVAATASTSAAAIPTVDPRRGIGSNRYRYERESLNRARLPAGKAGHASPSGPVLR